MSTLRYRHAKNTTMSPTPIGPYVFAILAAVSLRLCAAAPASEPLHTGGAADHLLETPAHVSPPLLPSPSPLQVALRRVLDVVHRVENVTRQHPGDVFNAYDADRCVTDTCVGLSSGTASLYRSKRSDANESPTTKRKRKLGQPPNDDEECRCQCLPHLTSFREDLNICVDDIHECTLAPFVSGSSAERIPFVFLPLRGQIIHPSKEISFQGVKAPICAVSGAQYLTTTGWNELRNPLDTDVPFRLFRDEGRTFLQWLGEPDMRHKMQGRLILVHLMCRDMSTAKSTTHAATPEDNTAPGQSSLTPGGVQSMALQHQQNIFSPCVAFRVVGTPIKFSNNVTEVSFQSETQTTAATSTIGLSTKEYIAITICSLLLGLVYVASVFLYLYVKKKKTTRQSTGDADPNGGPAGPSIQNDQVTFGAGFSRNNSLSAFGDKIRAGSLIGDPRRDSGRLQQKVPSAGGGNAGSGGNGIYGRHSLAATLNGVEELGVVKNNPLLKHFSNFSDGSEFPSDISNSNSECEDEHVVDGKIPNLRYATSVGVGPSHHQQQIHPSQQQMDNEYDYDGGNNSGGETECLPEENVSIVEDMSSEDKLENMKAIVNGTMRRKLYFNPAYFEPHLLMSPPSAAIEFLNKIREVISIAKYKMAAKRYQPSLIMIPEERNGTAHDSDTYYQLNATRRTSSVHTPSIGRCKSSASSSCIGCPGCAEAASNNNNAAKSDCRNCGDKRNSIRKWLEDVSTHENSAQKDRHADDGNSEHNILDKSTDSADSSKAGRSDQKPLDSGGSSSDSDTLKANSTGSVKRNAPAPPTSTPTSHSPKIISHYLKPQDIAKPANDILEVNNNNLRSVYNKNTAQSFVEPTKVYDKMKLYNHLTKSGGELFNNPQFQHGSPPLSHRSRTSSQKSKSSNQQLQQHREVLDQFATLGQTLHQNQDYEVMQSLKQMPDMIYEAMAKDYTKRKNNQYNSGSITLPQPDYDDSTLSKKYDDVPPYIHVPTPDYNTYGRSNKTNPQPDSPIYTRKSPHHLIVDYETDSLERASTKFSRSSATPTGQSNSSDLSSQPSPSLSNALPLEEEVEVRHTVYDCVEGFRKDGVEFTSPRISFSNLLGRPQLPPKEPRIKYNTPSQGSMTIEVEHSPSEYEQSTDSEQFEPDTLDRKSKKMHSTPPQTTKNANLWSQHLIKANNFLNESEVEDKVRYSSLENMSSLPDMNQSTIITPHSNSQLILRSSGSFKSNSLSHFAPGLSSDEPKLQKNFNSLREIYEAKNQKNIQQQQHHQQLQDKSPAVISKQQQQRMMTLDQEKREQGRLLTLEARHSRRQRQTNGVTTLKKPVPPDVVPSETLVAQQVPLQNYVYDHPKKPTRAVEQNTSPYGLMMRPKNLSGWNTSEQHQQRATSFRETANNRNDYTTLQSDQDTLSSSSSESTEVTGVSDTQINSERGSAGRRSVIYNGTVGSNDSSSSDRHRKYSQIQKNSSTSGSGGSSNEHPPMEILKNFMSLGEVRNRHLLDASEMSDFSDTSTLKSGSTNFYYKRNLPASPSRLDHPDRSDDIDKIEIVSSKSLSIHNVPISNDDNDQVEEDDEPSLMQDLTSTMHNLQNPVMMANTKVFRVEVNPSTHGMQIALGLKERVRKSKDLKYAWKRFVNIATSKFQGNGTHGKTGDGLDKSSVLSDGDEGISSLHDDSMTVLEESRTTNGTQAIISRTPSTNSDLSCKQSRPVRCDPDSGYMSADSNESKMNSKKLYERFNFRSSKNSAASSSKNLQPQDSEIDFAQKNMSRMQEIKETTQEQERSHSKTPSIEDGNSSTISSGRPSRSNEPLRMSDGSLGHQSQKPSVTGFIPKKKSQAPLPKKMQAKQALPIEPIEVNVFSSDDEKLSSSDLESETDDEEFSMDDLCESGAESVETNSVFFKNVRKTPNEQQQ